MIYPEDFYKNSMNQCSLSTSLALSIDIQSQDIFFLVSSKIKDPFLNGVVYISSEKKPDVENSINKIIQYFEKEKTPHSWWIEKDKEPCFLKESLEKRGLKL
jgi:predicted RNA-binding protein with PUA-like domain